jgi:transposase-like protein
VLAEQAASGLAPPAFARQAGIDVQRLHRWRRQLAKGRTTATAAVAPTFLEVHPRQAEPIEVVLRSGRMLRVSEQIDEAALLRLVEILERGASC